ncbi:MAG: hypothetical protein ABOK23_04735 [Candidatus Methanoperedens sp.]|nr:hypothetical protein [Candidatus Methanoperedens sp.]MCZ7394441.1 hypothetical protein [Candidatus Methanoperedens sp.]
MLIFISNKAFAPTKDGYKLFFERQGFSTVLIEYYDIGIDGDYITGFNNDVREEIERQSTDGKIKVDFIRLYYIGNK